MSDYVKGSAPQNLDAAKGGPTLERVRSFLKSEDVGMAGPPNKQDYSDKSGPKAKDKSLPAVKPRT